MRPEREKEQHKEIRPGQESGQRGPSARVEVLSLTERMQRHRCHKGDGSYITCTITDTHLEQSPVGEKCFGCNKSDTVSFRAEWSGEVLKLRSSVVEKCFWSNARPLQPW